MSLPSQSITYKNQRVQLKKKCCKYQSFRASHLRKIFQRPLLRIRNFMPAEGGKFDESILTTRGIRRANCKDLLHNGTFQEAIGPVLVLAQFFCLMPVRGVKSKSPKNLSFLWVSFRTWYCVIYVFTTIVDTGFTLNMVLKGAVDFRNLEPVIFHLSILIAAILFLRLAAKWPQLMLKWEQVEKQMPKFVSWKERDQLARRIKMITFVLITLSLTEHLLSTISAIHFANYCPSRNDSIESFFITVVTHLFVVFEYSPWLAVLGKLQNVLMTFGWSYMDIFLMITAMGLSSLFQRVQNSMESMKTQNMPASFWDKTRMQYIAICGLLEDVDSAISCIIMLSFTNNFYFVLIQCLRSLNKMPSFAHGIYFYFSLSFLLARTLMVCLCLSEVHDRARGPLEVLKHLPPQSYTMDVERFVDEVSNDEIALTGLNYFNVTRKLVLSVAGTIITYELVLIQFHEDQQQWNCGEE